MKPKYLVLGGIALTAGALGMAGAGTAVWCVMNRRPPQYFYPQPGSQSLPQTATPILPPAAVTPNKGSRPAQLNNENLSDQEIVALKQQQHFVSFANDRAPQAQARFDSDEAIEAN